MTKKPPTRRRWFQFSLRTFLVVIMLVGFGGAWVGMQLQQKRRHERVADEILKAGGAVDFSDAGEEVPAWKEWLFGSYAAKPVKLTFSKQPQGHVFAWIGAEPEKLSWEDGENSDSILSQTQGMNLIYLNLDLSEVTDAGLIHLKRMTSLENLILSNTQVTDARLIHLKGLARLEQLELSNTRITDAGLTHLKGLTRLERLDLDNTRITDAGLTHLKGMVSLKYLYLRNTQVTDTGLAHLKGLTRLDSLFLDNTQVTDIGLTHLKGLPRLELLYLDNTQITQAGVDSFQQAIPDCTIFYWPIETTSAPALP